MKRLAAGLALTAGLVAGCGGGNGGGGSNVVIVHHTHVVHRVVPRVHQHVIIVHRTRARVSLHKR